jgi:hypothetical protein
MSSRGNRGTVCSVLSSKGPGAGGLSAHAEVEPSRARCAVGRRKPGRGREVSIFPLRLYL